MDEAQGIHRDCSMDRNALSLGRRQDREPSASSGPFVPGCWRAAQRSPTQRLAGKRTQRDARGQHAEKAAPTVMGERREEHVQ